MINQKRKYQIIGMIISSLFILWGAVNIILNYRAWQYLPLNDWLLFDMLNNQGVFEFLPTPFSQIVVIISLLPDIPWNFFHYAYYLLYITITCPSELFNVGGANCEISNTFILIFSFFSILFSGYLAGGIIFKTKSKSKK